MSFHSLIDSLLGRRAHAEDVRDAPVEPLEATDPLEVGRTLTAWLYAGKTASIWARLSPEMRKVFGNESKVAKFSARILSEAGTEQSVIRERIAIAGGIDIYTRTALFEKSPKLELIEWSFDDARVVQGLTVSCARKPADSPYLDYATKTDLALPFSGEWYVFWGGRDVADNYHADVRDQRFAMDFVIIRDRQTYTGDGKRNEDYFCFGEAILAPGDGVVVAADNTRPDQTPGKMNWWRPLGNHVIIDHGNGEFSFLAHLQQGSVTVQPGRRVRRGDPIGKCGNSGHSSEPHLHYHVQDTATFANGRGMPVQFTDYEADGKRVSRGEVERGQRVQPAVARNAGGSE